MKSKYRFYLDGTRLEDEPRGWDDITFFIKQDKDLNGLLVFLDVTLDFFGDGYEYLNTKLYDDGFCSTVQLEIEEACDNTYKTIHKGLIKLSKVTVDEKNCSITVKPEDNSFYARIDKNRSLKTFPWITRSKNDAVIDEAHLIKIGFFSPTTGIYHTIIDTPPTDHTCGGYRVYEIFRHLIEFMTDGEVEFDSELFGPNGDFYGLCVTSGTVLFTVQSGLTQGSFRDTFPEISFEEFYDELHKKLNLGFYFDYSGLKPKMYIERAQDVFNGVTSATLDNVYNVKTKVDTQRLYNTLHIGSEIIADVPTPALQFPENIDWLGFKEETYNILGDCGVDTELDLVSSYIISSNVIEDAVETPSNSYEGSLVLVDSREFNTDVFVALQDNTLSSQPPYYYNQRLINGEVAKRFYGYVPSSIAKFLGVGDNTFFATRTASGAQTFVANQTANCQQLIFDDDFTAPNNDNNNNWNTTNNSYVCPLNGIYHFSTLTKVTLYPQNPPGFAMITNYITFSRFDSSNNFIADYETQHIQHTIDQNTTYNITLSAAIYLNAGDIVKAYYCHRTDGYLNTPSSNPTAFKILFGSTIACDNDVSGGGIYQTNDPKDYLGLLHEFDYPIDETTWASIKANPRGNLKFAQANQDFRLARIDTLQYSKNKVSLIKLVRSINT